MLARLLDFLFPPRCPGCNRAGKALCPACIEQIEPARVPPLEGLAEVRALGLYRGPLRAAIRRLKMRGREGQARALARLLDPPPGLLVPVPCPPLRLHLRGFNLAELLARSLDRPWANLLHCPDRPEQKHLKRGQRWRNKPFQARGRLRGPVVLVDDLVTTGSTLISCARALREAGASEVRAVVAAYAMYTSRA